MRKALSLTIGLLLLIAGSFASPVNAKPAEGLVSAPGLKEFTMEVDGAKRTYSVYVPNCYKGDAAFPLVVMLHGAGATGQGVIQETGWDKKADQEGFIAVFPDAMRANPKAAVSYLTNPQMWNDGSGRAAFLRGVNDSKFIAAIIDKLHQQYRIDPGAVFLTGFSNGASMAFRAAIDLPDKITAIAPVAGHYWPIPGPSRLPKPVPTLFIAGTDDPLNPVNGGTISLPWGIFEQPPLLESIGLWAAKNGYSSDPVRRFERSGLRICEFSPGPGGVIRACIIEGLGHLWPGGTPIFPESFIGRDPGLLNATDAIWAFFAEVRANRHKGGQ